MTTGSPQACAPAESSGGAGDAGRDALAGCDDAILSLELPVQIAIPLVLLVE